MAASLELAITAIRSGRKEEGRQLLNLLIQQNPNDELAWLWMSSVVNTDEQRARCLYHVLAINPENQLAQRGLKILGIVVTDSRPVKIPRDSQPIKIPKPTPTSQPAFPSVAQVGQAAPAEERRPFRLDPEAIVAELPFTPVTRPFAAMTEQAQTQQLETPSQPVPVIQASIEPGAAAQSPIDTKPLPDPSEPVVPVQVNPAITHAQPQPPSAPVPVVQPGTAGPMPQAQPASEPVPVIQPNTGVEPAPIQSQTPSEPVPIIQPNPGPVQSPQLETGQLRPPSEPVPVVQQTFYPQYPPVDPMSRQETRPTQPLPATYSNVTQVMPQQTQAIGPGNQLPPPAVGHSNATMGMPTQNYPVQNQPQPIPGVHSNPTMGFAPGQGNSQGQHPSEPVPVIHSNGTMPMPQYAQPQFQPAMAQGYAIHSNATMAMPLGYDPLAALSAPLYNDYRGSNAPRSGPRRNKRAHEEDEGDEVNILAVIIFGSLSVTALGGLGMLILLMFTAA